MRFLLLFILLLSAQVQAQPQAQPEDGHCLSKHLQDAVDQNEHRLPLYLRASRGKSLLISLDLIRLERLSLVGDWATGLDRKARTYQQHGIGLLCEEFLPMSQSPDFRSSEAGDPPRAQDFVQLDAKALKEQLIELNQDGSSFAELAFEVQNVLRTLDREPRLNCMVRHILASVYQFAIRAPDHLQKAAAAKLPAPEKIIRSVILDHLNGLPIMQRLDERAVLLQEAGLPILCQDVPPIPTGL
jgi:hypothetical protein